MRKIGYGEATGKIILMGEHSVVYQKPAIAIPFKQVKVSAHASIQENGYYIKSSIYEGDFSDHTTDMRGIKALLDATLTYLNIKSGIHLIVENTIPFKRGLGSSAAISIAIVKSIFDLFEKELEIHTLHTLVDVAEKIHHLNPSGIDATTIISQNPIYYQKDIGKNKVSLRLNAVLVIADTGVVGLSKEAVKRVQEKWIENPVNTKNIIDELGRLTNIAKDALEKNEIEVLGDAMNQSHILLKELEVSNGMLDKMVSTALKHNALGSKLTGGGKGGCMIALTTDYNQAEIIKKALEDIGAKQVWLYKLGE